MLVFRTFAMAARLAPVFLASLAVTAATDGRLVTGPSAGDMTLSPFYRWSDAMPALPGVVLKKEPLALQETMPAASQAMRILYTSTDQRWHSGQVPVSGVLFLPDVAPPSEGWPLLAWAHGTLGIADRCAPSWTGLRERDAAYVNRWLERGFAVVATDYQGLGGPGPHPYTFWQAEGRSILDAIRAARAIGPQVISDRVFLAGQSQGGGAALGAAILAETYAPQLNILGAVLTAPNSTFPDGPVALPARQSNTIFLSLASGGLRENAPRIEDLLTPKGLELLEVARRGCTREIALKSRELRVDSVSQLLTVTPEALDALRMPTTDMPQAAIPFPVLIATGQADRTIAPLRQYAVAAALCAAGNQVSWRLYDGLGHDGVLHGSLKEAFAFVQGQLAGQGFASTCRALERPGPPGERNPHAPFNDD
ncbi:Secretory lipase [Pseudomonas sp. NFACC32-1]|uniref:alpha/beta fold hydrolase n=1 Tax=unclassified Pseudomonas TaxID=196821 RepID=UPI000876780D|nr:MULTISPECIES: alpha/beta fold hydrolase [unclassified Pseudomonas]SCX44655.1 Secretory lipase [Pseudomonas sp. NFACC32-1]SFX58209.1 Secretory lipase [Pseudomonas sp. NFACC36]